ncbi:MAG: hypothetical protein V3V68_04890 [Nitrosomonadaceae bacterium]
MSDFTDWTQDELAERPSVGSIEATGSILVKADNVFSKDYEALAQGTSGQVLLSEGADAVPAWSSDSDNWDTAYDHSQDHSQAHTDYLINNGSDETSGTLTAAAFVTTGDITIDSDSSQLKLGAEQDYLIGWDGDDAVHTITVGNFVFTGGEVGIGTEVPTGSLTVRHLDSDDPTYDANVITNGDFASDLSDWVVDDGGAEWVWDTGKARHVAGNTSDFYQNITTVNGYVYYITLTSSSRTAGSASLTMESAVGSLAITTDGAKVYAFRATTSGTVKFTFTPTSTYDGSIDNIICRRIISTSPTVTISDNGDTPRIEFRAKSNNTYMGRGSGALNIGGIVNLAMGTFSLENNVEGDYNVGIGSDSLRYNVHGSYNMAIGAQALRDNVTGFENVAVGRAAMRGSTTASYNIAIGGTALFNSTTGILNTVIGFNTGRGITTGGYNTIIGAQVSGLAANLTGYVILANGAGVQRIIIDGSGHVQIPGDDIKLEFGAAKDYDIQWDGDFALHTISAGSFWFAGGSLIIGDNTDNTEFEADGTMVMNGAATVWDDIRVPALAVRLGVIRPPTFAQMADDGAGSTGVFALMFADNAEEQVFFNVQIPHSYKEGTDLHAHVHWSPQTADTGQVDWLLEYTIANVDGTFGNTVTITMSDDGDGTINKHQKSSDIEIDGSSLTISAMLACRLYRDGGQGNDDLVGNAAFLEFDFHYEQDTVGSREEYTK